MATCKKEHEKMIANLYELKKRRKLADIRISYHEGVNRIFNNQNLYSEYSLMIASNRADYYSILSDWKNVGTDLNKAIKDYKNIDLGEQCD